MVWSDAAPGWGSMDYVLDVDVRSCLDADGDGVTPCTGDCEEGNSAIGPSAIDIAGNGIDENCDAADELLMCAAAGPRDVGVSEDLRCPKVTGRDQWDTWVVPVAAGNCVDVYIDNEPGTRADLMAYAAEANGVSVHGLEPDSSELDDEWTCTSTPWDGFGCPAAQLTASSTGNFEILVNQWDGNGTTPGTDACYDSRGERRAPRVGLDQTARLPVHRRGRNAW